MSRKWCSSSSARPSTSRPRRRRRRLHRRGTAPTRRGSGRPPGAASAGERDAREPGHHHAPATATAARDGRPAGEGRQRPLRPRLLASASSATSASRRAARTRRTRSRSPWPAAASTPGSRPSATCPLPDSACVYCGNCIGVCPTGALMFKTEYDMRAGRHVGRDRADGDRHDLPVLRRRLHALRSTSRTTRS